MDRIATTKKGKDHHAEAGVFAFGLSSSVNEA